MTLALILIAVLMLGSAATAMLLRNLIHSALLLILSWAGVAAPAHKEKAATPAQLRMSRRAL